MDFLVKSHLFIIGFGLAVIALEYVFREETVIRFEIKPADWMVPVFSLYVLLSFSIFLEYKYFHTVIKHYDNNSRLVLDYYLESGGLIPFICFGLSLVFGMLSKRSRFYLHPKYCENTAKRCFSLMLASICGFLIFYILKSTNSRSEEIGMFISRITVWVASIIGIWLPFGLGCKGLREKYKESRKKDDYKDKDSLLKIVISKVKEYLISIKLCVKFEWPMYSFIFMITLLMYIGTQSSLILNNIYFYSMMIMISFAVGFVFMFIIVYSYFYPGVYFSYIILVKAIQERNGKKSKFSYLRYTIEKDKDSDDKIILVVKERKVKGADHPDLFLEQKPKSYICNDDLKNVLFRYLSEKNKEREKEIKDSFKNCEKRQYDKVLNSKD